MTRFLAAVCTALIAAWVLAGSATTASAHYGYHHHYHHHGGCCGPVAPTYVYNTVHKVSHVTRYHDVSRTNYVHRTHRIIHITRVRPIIYIHSVTRIHHHTVSVVHTKHIHMTEYLPPERIVTHSVINTYSCSCGCHHHRRY